MIAETLRGTSKANYQGGQQQQMQGHDSPENLAGVTYGTPLIITSETNLVLKRLQVSHKIKKSL